MKVAIIGSGNVGKAIAHATTGVGHAVTVAAPVPDELESLASEVPVATTTSNEDAVGDADVVVFAVPADAVEGIVGEVGERLSGKIVIDVTNPLKPDLSGLSTDGLSVAEQIQREVPDAKVVKAFNTVLAANQADPVVDGTRLDGFVAGDDDDAKARVSELLAAIGYRPVDVGPLVAARYLEGMAYLNIALNARNDMPWQTAWKLVGPMN